MNITVKLFTSLRIGRQSEYTFQVRNNITFDELICMIGVERKEISIVLLNGIVVRRIEVLNENDIIALFPTIGGG